MYSTGPWEDLVTITLFHDQKDQKEQYALFLVARVKALYNKSALLSK